MRIGVNLLSFAPDRIGGLEHYVRRQLATWLEDTGHVFILFPRPVHGDAFRSVAGRLVVHPIEREPSDGSLVRALADERVDLWWCPWVVWWPLRPPVPTVVTIPDLQHEHFPEYFGPDELRWRRLDYFVAAHCAHAVLTFSEQVRDDVGRGYGVGADRLHAIPLDVGFDWADSEPSPGLLAGLEREHGRGFLYYPANSWPHKDHGLLLRALRRLADGGQVHRLVLTGAGDHDRAGVERAITELGLDEQVKLLGTVAPAAVRGLYRLASALVFPSRFEGFGMPVLEAMRSGTPVLSSDAGSLRELGGGAVLHFRAGDLDQLVAGIQRVTGDQALRADLARRGVDRAAGFSWRRTARTTAEVFARAIHAPAPDTPVARALTGLLDRLQQAAAESAARLEAPEQTGAGPAAAGNAEGRRGLGRYARALRGLLDR